MTLDHRSADLALPCEVYLRMALEEESQTYFDLKDRLLGEDDANAGKFVLIKGRNLLGVFDTYGEALAEGYATLGGVPFLARQLLREEPVIHASRAIH